MYQIHILVFLLFTSTFSFGRTINTTPSVKMTVAALPAQIKVIQQNRLIDKDCSVMGMPQAHWDRISLEFFILCKALNLGGIQPKFTFIQYPNHRRLFVEGVKGRFTMPLVSLWKHEVDPEIFFESSTFLDAEHTELGIYMLPENALNANIKTIHDLQSYLAVTQNTWQVDIATLKQMGVEYTTTNSYERMFKMIKAKRADFLLTSFTALENMQQKFGDISLLPVKGVKVTLNSARSFVVNKDAPNAELIYRALEKGLQLLRSKGLIVKYFQETGFMNEKVKDWKVLCCRVPLNL